jgi:uncharacterized membrane protein YvbJ
MVYCTKCGTKNGEDASHCTKCGANLEVSREERFERRAEEWGEQIGKRAGARGAIIGIIFGIIMIIVALSRISPEVREVIDPLFWPVIIIGFGILITVGSLYKYIRR